MRLNAEAYQKISATVKQRWGEGVYKNRVLGMLGKTPWNKGKTFDNKTRKKMSEAALKRHRREGNTEGGLDKRAHAIWNKYHSDNPIEPNDGFVIHHKDEDHFNDSPENLMKMTRPAHISLHHKGKPFSEEIRKRFSEAHKGKLPWCTGKKLSEEHRKKLSEAHKGQTCPWKGKVGPTKGIKHSEETKRKIAEAIKKWHAKRRLSK